MKSPLLQRCRWLANSAVAGQFGEHFGISSVKTVWVIDHVLPVMIAALAKTATHASGTRSLYSALMSPKVDVNIGKNLALIFDEPGAADNAVLIGCDRATSFLGTKLPQLAQAVSDTTGVKSDAIVGIVGLMTVLLFGLIKSHLHASQGQQYALIQLLKMQMLSVHDLVAQRYWSILYIEDIEEFQLRIEMQLELALLSFQKVSPMRTSSDITTIRINTSKSRRDRVVRNGLSFYANLFKKIIGTHHS